MQPHFREKWFTEHATFWALFGQTSFFFWLVLRSTTPFSFFTERALKSVFPKKKKDDGASVLGRVATLAKDTAAKQVMHVRIVTALRAVGKEGEERLTVGGRANTVPNLKTLRVMMKRTKTGMTGREGGAVQ